MIAVCRFQGLDAEKMGALGEINRNGLPIVVNIFLFHAFLAPGGLVIPLIIGVLELYLSFFAAPYSAVIKQLFRKNP